MLSPSHLIQDTHVRVQEPHKGPRRICCHLAGQTLPKHLAQHQHASVARVELVLAHFVERQRCAGCTGQNTPP